MNLESEDMGIVFVGNFNPAIFQPEWLYSHDLISEGELEYANQHLTVIHNAVSDFDIGSDIHLLVTVDRYQLRADFKYNNQIRDLTIGVFKLLEHCPITALGVNRSMHYKTNSKDEQQKILNSISGVEGFNDILNQPMVKTYELISQRQDGEEGYMLVRIGPSSIIENGIMIHVNNHHGKPDKSRIALDKLLKKLETSWDEMSSFALMIADKILEKKR
jgi:hypothetical protein